MKRTMWFSMLLVASVASAATTQTFSQGSLIIPMQANFQTEAGAASAYGLVWKLLYENRPGGTFSGAPVQIFWIVADNKGSPNRCIPTNLHAAPLNSANAGLAAGATNWNTGAWNDGCDMFVENAAQMPVVPVTYGTAEYNAFIAGTITLFPTTGSIWEQNTTGGYAMPSFDTNAPTRGKGRRPAALNNSGTCSLTGGAAPPCGATRFTRIQYQGGLFVIDQADAKRVLQAMTTVPHLMIHADGTGTSSLAGNSLVRMHMATTSFQAPVYKRITNVPPKIALVDFGGGVATVLQKYLKNAYLNGDANGKIGTDYVCGTPGPVGGTTNCASGTSGLIYDRLRGLDDMLTTGTYPKGYLNSKVAGKSRYKVMWAPHWELDGSNLASGGATNAQRANALENIAYFADQKGNGVLAECASLEGYEGVVSGVPSYSATTNFMYNNQIVINNLASTPNGRNCTDPSYLSSDGMCMRYGDPSDPFSQVGDFAYSPVGGHVKHYRVSPGNTRRAGVKRLAYSWKNYPSGSDDTGDNGWDFATITQKDNDPEKATIIYIAGHDLSGDAAGTRIVLNTLLNLGSDPIPSDRAYAAPVAMLDATNSNKPTLFSATYQVLTGTPVPGSQSYAYATGKNWRFPYTAGNVRARDIVSLTIGEGELNDAVIWSADAKLPLPQNRNLFTYFGGKVEANPALTGGRVVKKGVIQHGWVPERIEYTRLNGSYGTVPNPNCVDAMKYGDYKDALGGPNTGGLVPGADGICDLQQAMLWSNFTWNISGSGNHSVPPGHLSQLQADVPYVQQFLQMVRGHCFATRSELGLSGSPDQLFEPTDSQCINMGGFGDNRAHLGGAVRSSVAVMTPSAKIKEATARPTIAFVGTWDGQLHAIYVGGGAGYTGPSEARPHLNPDATCSSGCPSNAVNTFKTDYAALFAGGSTPDRGTELWAFMPASQLSQLRGNNARVDSSPVIEDVFVDLYGDGVRRWHTVLVASIGGNGREVFAFDVTNPLKPVLLWDLVGGKAPGQDFAPVAMSDYDISGDAKPTHWLSTEADFVLPPVADPGRAVGSAEGAYPYEYSELGGSRGLAIGQIREGLEPTFAVFVASNSAGVVNVEPTVTCTSTCPADTSGRAMSKALVVHAIDVATGQKLWQFKHPYVVNAAASDYRGADNTVPPPASVVNGTDGAGTLYAGDMEGRLWELNASTGQSLTALRNADCTTAACNFPAFDTNPPSALTPQPITSSLAIAKVPSGATGPLSTYGGERVLILGTAGTDWVPASVAGEVHTLLLDSRRRKPVSADGTHLDGTAWLASDARTSAASNVTTETGGVLQNPVGMPLPLGSARRVYGNITVSGESAFVPLVDGQGGDPMNVSKTLAGATLELPLSGLPANATAARITNFNYGTFGGVALIEVGAGASKDVYVITDEVSKTAVNKASAGSTEANRRAANPALGVNPSFPYRLYNVVRRFFSQQ
ncbi:MAG: hypothetical protein ACOZQL_23160 [Myxococcota bacterium]